MIAFWHSPLNIRNANVEASQRLSWLQLKVAGKIGFEPMTHRLTTDCTAAVLLANVVPSKGIEPLTRCLQGSRSAD